MDLGEGAKYDQNTYDIAKELIKEDSGAGRGCVW